MPKQNAFYAQSGGVTAVINASACGVIETARKHKKQIGNVYAGRNGIIGALLEDMIDNNKISTYIPTTEIELPIREKVQKIMRKGVYMVFMRGSPSYPSDVSGMNLMSLLRQHYPWVVKNRKKPELSLEHFDIDKSPGFEFELLKHAKFGEIP